MTRDTKRRSKADRAFHRPSVNKHWNRWVMSDLDPLPRRTKCKKHKGLFFFQRRETHALSKVNKRSMHLAVQRNRDLKYYEDIITDDRSEDSSLLKETEQPVLIDKETLLHEFRLEEEEYWYCIYHELPTASY